MGEGQARSSALAHGSTLQGLREATATVAVARESRQRFESAEDRSGKRSSPSIVAALARAQIEQGFRSRISLSSLARELKISREHLCRSFKASYQVTVTDYIRAKRIQEALLLAEEPDVQLKEIGHAVGYATYNEFFRAFKRVVQMTPTAYLRRIRAGRSGKA